MDNTDIDIYTWKEIQRILQIMERQSEWPYKQAYKYLVEDIIPAEIKYVEENYDKN